MNDSSANHSADQVEMNRHEPTVQPDGRSKYGAKITFADGVVTLTIRRVERKWLPLWLFGRVVVTRRVNLHAFELQGLSIVNAKEGLLCQRDKGGYQGLNENLFPVVGDDKEAKKNRMASIEILGPEWPIDLRENVWEKLDSAIHRKQRGLSFSINGTSTVAVVLFMLYLWMASLNGVRAQQPGLPAMAGATVPAPIVAPQLTPEEEDGMSSAGVAQRELGKSNKVLPIKEAMSQAVALQVRPAGASGKSIVIWADPLCPHCRDFEQKIVPKLPSDVGITVIPVSFIHGSRPLVAYAACGSSQADRATRWENMMSDKPNLDFSAQCNAGPGIADRNTTLFARAGLRATPTVMTPDGKTFDGENTSVDEVVNWIAKK